MGSVRLIQEVENERVETQRRLRRVKWEYGRLTDLEEAKAEATKLGWLENKVQLRRFTSEFGVEYLIEPYEGDCDCPAVIRPPR